MSSKRLVYAVARGRTPGLYFSWGDAQLQVSGYSQAKHKSFKTVPEAVSFLRLNGGGYLVPTIFLFSPH